MVDHHRRVKLLTMAAALVLWLMLASVMGASASHFDTEQAPASFTAYTSKRWMQTNYTEFFADARVRVDIIRQPGSVVLAGRTEFNYAFQGGNSRTFWRFNTSTSTWATVANAPGQVKEDGSALSSDGDRYIYALQGGGRAFWRYDTISNAWVTMARTPENVKSAGGLTYDGNGAFYALRDDATNRFWRYNVASDTWTVLTNAPGAVSDGGCLVSDHKTFVYALQGNGQRNFWRYNVTSNSWSTLAQIPYAVRYGGAMVFDGVDSIYAIPGWSQAYFLRYSISEDRWYILANVPSTVSYGGSLAFSYPGTVFAFSGVNTNRYWRYNETTGVWSASSNAPGIIGEGGALANGPMVLSRNGTIISVTFDTGNADSAIQGLFWTESLATGTDITFEIRASNTLAAGVPLAPWTYVGGTSPATASLPNGRYIQWRATLSTTNVHLTPTLQEVRVYYA
jgi:hypothetical protein